MHGYATDRYSKKLNVFLQFYFTNSDLENQPDR